MSNEAASQVNGGKTPQYLIVGQVVAPFGVKGEMKVNILTEFPGRLRTLGQLILAPFSFIEPDAVPTAALNPRTLRSRGTASQTSAGRPAQTFRSPTDPTPFTIESAHIHKGQLLLKLDGVGNPDQVQALRGYWVLIPTERAKKLPRGSHYLYEIVGLDVYTTEGKPVGKIDDVITAAANDVYIVHGPGVSDPTGELLVPAIKTVVKRIELKRNRIVIAPLEEWA